MNKNNNILDFPGTAPNQKTGRFLIPDKLTEARLALGFTQTDLSKSVGVSRQAISAYELGNKKPEPEVMRKISDSLKQPIAFFVKQSDGSFGKFSPNFFRKIGADTKKRNLACEVYSKWFADTVFAFDSLANFPKVDIPQFEPNDIQSNTYNSDEIENIAETVRKYFGLGLGPISNVLRLVEAKGVIACRLRMENKKIEAFSYWSGDRPFIFLASYKNSAVRSRFDVAHELGHLCMHRWVGREEIEDKERLKQIESEANRFAGSFLLPRKSFPNEVYSTRAESFIDLKVRWKVAIQAMVYRCKDLGIFDDRQITNIYKQISYKKWRTIEPLDQGSRAIEMEHPMLLGKVAELIFQSGKYEKSEFLADVALSRPILEQLIGTSFDEVEDLPSTNFQPTLK